MPHHFEQRAYQSALIQQVFQRWGEGKQRLMLQLVTGGGKTVIFSALAREFLDKQQSVLVVAHLEELIFQAAEKLESIGGGSVGIIKGNYPSNPECRVQVASIQALSRRQKWPDASLVVIDEAHHFCSSSYQKLFDYYKE